ncbi:MAG: hypothetical protein Tsb002_30380 [Wenzhouxiangellaceae bacterium]
MVSRQSMASATMLIIALAFVSTTVQAATPGVDQRQLQQQQRITQGVVSGSLTAGEAGRLNAQQWRVQRHEWRVKADGVVTRHERAGLHRHQQRASHRIHQQKHDSQRRD